MSEEEEKFMQQKNNLRRALSEFWEACQEIDIDLEDVIDLTEEVAREEGLF